MHVYIITDSDIGCYCGCVNATTFTEKAALTYWLNINDIPLDEIDNYEINKEEVLF